MSNQVYINNIAKFLPNEPVSNDEMESILGLVNGKPSRSKNIVLRQNGIKNRYYVIDKALNYGNSGGPIVVQETGRVVALCSRFQPVKIPQGGDINVSIPSLYGVATSLKNIEEELKTYLKL